MKKLNKIAQGLVSLMTVIVLLGSILAASLFYQTGITGNIVKENSNSKSDIKIQEVNNVYSLSQLNEGWYQVRNGYVYYLENFDSFVPLSIKIKNPSNLNGLVVVDSSGKVTFDSNQWNLPDKQANEKSSETQITGDATRLENTNQETNQNIITGEVSGLEGITGFQTAPPVRPDDILNGIAAAYNIKKEDINRNLVTQIRRDPDSYRIINSKLYRKEDLGSNYLNLFSVNPSSGQESKFAAMSQTEFVDFQSTGATTSTQTTQQSGTTIRINGKNIDISLNDARLILNNQQLQYISDNNIPSLIQAMSNGKLNRNNGVTIFTSASGEKRAYIPAGTTNFNVDGVKFTTQGTDLLVIHVEGNQYSVNGKKYVMYNGKLLGLDNEDDKYELLDPLKPNEKKYISLGFDPNELKTDSSGRPAATSAQVSAGFIEIGIRNKGIVKFSTKDMTQEEIDALTKAIADGRKSGGTVYASDKEVVIEIGDEKITYTSNSIVYTKGGIKYQETTYQTGLDGVRIPVLKTYDYNQKLAYLSINGNQVDLELLSPDIINNIDWAKYNPSVPFTYPLKDKTTVEVVGNTVTTYDANNNIIRRKNLIIDFEGNQIGESTTEVQYEGKTIKSIITTTVTTQDNIKTEKKEIKNKNQEIQSTEYTFTREGETPITVKFDSKGNPIFNGNTIPKDIFDGLFPQDLFQNFNEQTYNSLQSVNSLITEARNSGINLATAKASFDPATNTRTIRSGDGLRTTTETDGTLTSRYTMGKGADDKDRIRTETIRRPDGSTTQITCTDLVAGCTENDDGTINGKYTSIEYNEKDKTVTRTKSTSNGYTVDVTYGTPSEIGQDTYITRISIENKYYFSLGAPDKDGYQQITNRGTGNTYYKDGKIYVKDASGNYVRSSNEEDKQLEKDIKYAGIEGKDHKEKADKKRDEDYKKERHAARVERVQDFFLGLERIFTEFRGLGYYASLFRDEKDLLNWRNKVDEIFSKLYLGTDYWSSKICTDYADLKTQNNGVAYAETPQGLAQVAAHIEATVTQPIKNEKGEIIYIYKITFQVRNGDYDNDPRAPENMSINLLIMNQGANLQLFKKNINIGRGSSFGRFGSTKTEKSEPAIVKESKNVYDKICITFDRIPSRWKIENNRLCNKIEQSSGEPTPFTRGQQSQPQGTDADLNDF